MKILLGMLCALAIAFAVLDVFVFSNKQKESVKRVFRYILDLIVIGVFIFGIRFLTGSIKMMIAFSVIGVFVGAVESIYIRCKEAKAKLKGEDEK